MAIPRSLSKCHSGQTPYFKAVDSASRWHLINDTEKISNTSCKPCPTLTQLG